MVLRNWYNAFKAYRMKGTIPQGMVKTTGTKETMGYYTNTGNIPILTLTADAVSFNGPATGGTGIVLGRGRTPVTLDDYWLEDQITSGLSCTLSTAVDDDNDAIYRITITSTSAEDITIGEIGLRAMAYTQKGSSSGNTSCLVERTVLDNPITIPAGGIGLIDYAIKLPIPEA